MLLKRLIICLSCSALIFSASSFLVAQTRTAKVNEFKLNDLKAKGFDLYRGTYAVVNVSSSKTIVFARNKPEGSSGFDLRSFVMKKSGRTKGSKLLLSGISDFEKMSVIWLSESAASPAAKGHGILFVLSWESQKLVITAVFFDANGKFLNKRVIKEFPFNENAEFEEASMGAAYGNGKILVAFGGSMEEEISKNNYEAKAVIWISELDLNGNIIREDIPMTLPNGGSMVHLEFYNPAWTGQRWFIPTCMTEYTLPTAPSRGNRPEPSRNLLMLTLVGSNTAWMKTLMVETPNDAKSVTTPGYDDISFLPSDSSASPSIPLPELEFIIHHKQVLEGKDFEKFDFFSHNFYVVTVAGNNGNLVTKPKKIKIRAWKRNLKYDPEKKFDFARDSISPVIRDKDGKLVFTQSRSFSRYWEKGNKTKNESENQNVFYSLDPKRGKVKVLNRSSFILQDDWTFLRPHIFSMNNVIYVINSLYYGSNPWQQKAYFSIF